MCYYVRARDTVKHIFILDCVTATRQILTPDSHKRSRGYLFPIVSQLATLHGKCHDQPQHIAQLFQTRKLPVIATVTAAHDPGEEGGRYAWTEDN